MTGGLMSRVVSCLKPKKRVMTEMQVSTWHEVCRRFTITQIRDATDGFDRRLVIEQDSFGKIYEGIIHSDLSILTEIEVAVHRAEASSWYGIHDLIHEMSITSTLRHRHVISLMGFCNDEMEMILVYEYMAKGDFTEHLRFRDGTPALGWRQRLEICISVARGLHYLHTGARETIIHRDVKTKNILLDKNWVAKLDGFVLSMALDDDDSSEQASPVGSLGYLDPEYVSLQLLTVKSDVYSFGVVLFEVLCGRPVHDAGLPEEQVYLAKSARLCYEKEVLQDIVDPALKGKIVPSCFITFTDTAYRCTANSRIDRPTMEEVLWNLHFALQQQDSSEEPSGSIDDNVKNVTENVMENVEVSYTADATSPPLSQHQPSSS